MSNPAKYYIKTFGCQQNHADSERVRATLEGRGMRRARGYKDANYVVVNTCMVRETAENRVYGLLNNLSTIKSDKQSRGQEYKIIVTGCMVGIAFRDSSGKFLQKIKRAMPSADEFLPIEEIGFDFAPVRTSDTEAWVPISNGCNNFCTFCIVPFTRGREISRPYESIIAECLELKEKGYKKVTLLGMNVNSYGADLIVGADNIQVMRDLPGKDYFSENPKSEVRNTKQYQNSNGLNGKRLKHSDFENSDLFRNSKFEIRNSRLKPVFVKHLGRMRIPTLFPHLLKEVAEMGFEEVNFISSNPWDFSNELIEVIARNKNISRTLHFALQSGDDQVLKRMNRWYSTDEYLDLIAKLKSKIPNLRITTDIIVGFCGETDEEFENTVALCKKAGFYKAYISIYSSRPMTAATKVMADDVPHVIKKQRWQVLEDLINKPNVQSFKNEPIFA